MDNGNLIRFLGIAKGSAFETEYQLLLAKDLNYVTNDEYKFLTAKIQSIIHMLIALIKSLKNLKPATRNPKPLQTDNKVLTMSQQELKTLLEIKDDPSLSQRSLAHRLNISLGLTNSILQNLIHRGLIKAQKMTGRKILYLITPKGMVQATNFIYDRVRETQYYYQYAKELLTSYLTELYNQGKRKVIIYGTNQLAEITYLSLLDSPLKLHSILSDDPSKKKFLGHQIFTISDFAEKYPKHLSQTSQKDVVLLSIISTEKMHQKIKKYKNILKNVKIMNIETVLKNNQQINTTVNW